MSPYRSLAQERFFHTKTAAAKGITPDMVAEYDAASAGQVLPEKIGQGKIRRGRLSNDDRDFIKRAKGQ